MWTWNSDPVGTDAANPNSAGAATFAHNVDFPDPLFDAQEVLHQNGNCDYDPAGLSGRINTCSYVSSALLTDYL